MKTKIIADSLYAALGSRLTTFELIYPRFIHAQFMTHRVFSRNAQSNRAIPTRKLLHDVAWEPAMPVYWGKNCPGMSAKEESALDAEAVETWRLAAWDAACTSEDLLNLGLHKQIANRPLEPFQHIRVICSSTEWENFFKLRIANDAQPEIQTLAKSIKEQLGKSSPKELKSGEWHLPYVTDEESKRMGTELAKKVSTARCARVSYLSYDKVRDPGKDKELHDALEKDRHMSPFEHIATPGKWRLLWGNYRGWEQYRKEIEGTAA